MAPLIRRAALDSSGKSSEMLESTSGIARGGAVTSDRRALTTSVLEPCQCLRSNRLGHHEERALRLRRALEKRPPRWTRSFGGAVRLRRSKKRPSRCTTRYRSVGPHALADESANGLSEIKRGLRSCDSRRWPAAKCEILNTPRRDSPLSRTKCKTWVRMERLAAHVPL
jgi:hypothetical protein